ncbi:MAG: mechanosensitive ion channel family protein [Candidatus Latescibacterota bacterium]
MLVMLGIGLYVLGGRHQAYGQTDSVGVAPVVADRLTGKVADSLLIDEPSGALGKVSDTTVVLMGGEQPYIDSDSTKADSTSGGVRKKATEQLSKTAGKLGNIFSLGNIVAAFFILVGTYFCVRLMTWLIGIAAERFGQYRLKLMMLIPVVRILMWSAAIYLVISGIFNPSTDKLFAFAASAGLAVGFAAQDVLKNIFGGVLIILDRPFQVGDKIQVGSHYGEVINIGLRTVRIVTPDDSVVSIPNGDLVNQSVSNSNTGALDCQVVIELYLPPTVDLRVAKKLAYEAAVTSRFVYLNKPVVVMVQDAYDKGFLTKLKVKAYVLDTRYEFAFASDVSERAKAAFVQAGFYGIPGEKFEGAFDGSAC